MKKDIVRMGSFEKKSNQRRQVYDSSHLCPTLQAAMGCGGGTTPFVLEVKRDRQ